MWKYKSEVVEIRESYGESVVDKMNEFGQLGWEVFFIERIQKQYYTRVGYRLFMKKPSTKSEQWSPGQGF